MIRLNALRCSQMTCAWRQRMLYGLGQASVADAALQARQDFEKAPHDLNNIPLSMPNLSRQQYDCLKKFWQSGF